MPKVLKFSKSYKVKLKARKNFIDSLKNISSSIASDHDLRKFEKEVMLNTMYKEIRAALYSACLRGMISDEPIEKGLLSLAKQTFNLTTYLKELEVKYHFLIPELQVDHEYLTRQCNDYLGFGE
jgi:hypothetical protein